MSYENTFAYLDLETDFRGIKINQLRWGVEPDGTEVLLCTEYEHDFHIVREALGLDAETLPIINIQFYKAEYLRNYDQSISDDIPVEDMPEMLLDPEAKNHIVSKAIAVIPFKDVWSQGTPSLWKEHLNKDAKFGDFSLMFFAKDAEKHISAAPQIDKDIKQYWVKTTLDFALEYKKKQTVVFCGMS